MTEKNNDLTAGVLLLGVSIIIYISSNNIPRMVVTSIGPDFMPKLVAAGMGFFSILLILKTVRTPYSQSVRIKQDVAPHAQIKRDVRILIQKHVDLITISLLLIYAVGVALAGFIIATAVYLFCQISLMRMKLKSNTLLVVAVSICVSVAVYMLFTKVLYVMLPQGLLG